LPEWVGIAGVLLAYLVVMKWVMPKFGVPT
jgi:hypothetical protein